ncbi:hypothetical protein FisN_33Lh001, partial [Fistulifera solaris]
MTGRTAFYTSLWISSLLSWPLVAFTTPRPPCQPRTTPTSMAPNFIESIRQTLFGTEKEILLKDFPVPDSEAVRRTLSLIAVHPQPKENQKTKKNNIFLKNIQQWWNQQLPARDVILQKDVEILSAEEYLSLRRELRPDFQIPSNNPPITVDVEEEAIQQAEINQDVIRPKSDSTPSTNFDSFTKDPPQVILTETVPQTTPAIGNMDAFRPQNDPTTVRPISLATILETQSNQPGRSTSQTSYLQSLEVAVSRPEGTSRQFTYLESLDASLGSRVSQVPRRQVLLEEPWVTVSESSNLDGAMMKEESLETLQVSFVELPKPSVPSEVTTRTSRSYLESLDVAVSRPEGTLRQLSYLEGLDDLDASESFAGRMSQIPRQQEAVIKAMSTQQGWGTRKETKCLLEEPRVTSSDSNYLDGAMLREESLESLPPEKVQESVQYSLPREVEELYDAINTNTDNDIRNQLDQGGTSELTQDDTLAEIDPIAYGVSTQQESLFAMGESAADSYYSQSSTISTEETAANESRFGYQTESANPNIPRRASFSPVRSTVKDYNSTSSSPYLASLRGLKNRPFQYEKEPITDTWKSKKSFEATTIGSFSPVRASIKNVNSTSSSPYLDTLRGQVIAPFDFKAATFAASAKDESVTPNKDATPLAAVTPNQSATQESFADDKLWSAQPTKASFAPVRPGVKNVDATSSSLYLTALRETTTPQPRMKSIKPKVTVNTQANLLPTVGLKDENKR